MQKVNCSDKVLGEHSTQYKIDIDDRLTCKHVRDFGGKYLCLSNYHGSFNVIIFKTNHTSLTLKRIPESSDIDSSVTLKTVL